VYCKQIPLAIFVDFIILLLSWMWNFEKMEYLRFWISIAINSCWW